MTRKKLKKTRNLLKSKVVRKKFSHGRVHLGHVQLL